MPAKRSPTMVIVPNVSHTGIACFAANAATPPTWSVCSCVTTIASMSPGARPIRARRTAVSRTPNPQSIMTREPPASTTSPLPSLPLPNDAKRISVRASLQLVLEQREDPVARRRLVRRALWVLHRHEAARRGLDDRDPVLLRLLGFVLAPERKLRDPALVALADVGVGIRIADEVQAVAAVAVHDREPAAVEREADAAPGAVERLVDDELRDAVLVLLDARAFGL